MGVLHECVLYFCICACSAQLSNVSHRKLPKRALQIRSLLLLSLSTKSPNIRWIPEAAFKIVCNIETFSAGTQKL